MKADENAFGFWPGLTDDRRLLKEASELVSLRGTLQDEGPLFFNDDSGCYVAESSFSRGHESRVTRAGLSAYTTFGECV